jgi:hypothetical protein
MGIAADNKLLVVHVAMLLTGFVMLSIYGMIYRFWPTLANSPLATAQFWIPPLARSASSSAAISSRPAEACRSWYSRRCSFHHRRTPADVAVRQQERRYRLRSRATLMAARPVKTHRL